MNQQSATPKFGAGQSGKSRHGTSAPEVQAITNAAVPHSEEMRKRMLKYSITMGIRMVCLAAIFVFDGWYKLIPIVGAVVLPWVAVILANGGSDINHQENVDLLNEAPMYAVTGANTAEDDDVASPGDIIAGEIVPDDEDVAEGSAQPESAQPEANAAKGTARKPQPDNHTKVADHGHF